MTPDIEQIAGNTGPYCRALCYTRENPLGGILLNPVKVLSTDSKFPG